MILQTLVDHYHRLANDPESDVAAFGFSRQKVGFCIVLTPEGQLHAIERRIDEAADRPRPLSMVLPGQSKPSGAGINPCFLWDNATYMLGAVPDGRDPAWAHRRFEAFRDRHLALRGVIDDPAFACVCAFLETWDPASLADRSDTDTLHGSFGLFAIRGQVGYVHERPAVQAWWLAQLHGEAEVGSNGSDAGIVGQCLVTGETMSLARLHEPKIKGISGAQSSGAALVSFNLNAFTSFGKDQSFNAPISKQAAFQYATALNALLASDKHRVQLGDTTCVFWTERPTVAEDAFHATVADNRWLNDEDDAADEQEITRRQKLQDFFSRLRAGREMSDADTLDDATVPFYALGLSPNAARISVRFWLSCTVAELARRLARHVQSLEMVGRRPDAPPLTVRHLLRETVRDPKDIPPQLAGEITRAILTGHTYPRAFAAAINRRIRADRQVTHGRAAILKAWLTRNHAMEVPVALDTTRTDTPYLLGRLFAAYEKIQRDALGEKLNRTIRDSYLSAASATPASVFPRLYRLSQHHLNRIENPGLRIVREKLLGQIFESLHHFPSHLRLEDQGLFAIGYYHQTQAFYTSKSAANDAATTEQETTHA